jgi:SAM-dependent methyltransferase
LAVVKRELEDELIPRIPPPARVLDVGCGNGAFMVVAAATGYETVGVDVSIAAVARARANGFDAYTGALPGLTLPGQFQFVTLWDVIEHLDDPASTVRRAYDLLEPGGYRVVKAPLPGDGSFRLARHWQRARGLFLHVPDHVQFFTPASLETLLRRSGFAEVDMRRVGPMRGPKPWAGPRKFVARRLRRLEARLARSANLYAFAWKKFPVEQ